MIPGPAGPSGNGLSFRPTVANEKSERAVTCRESVRRNPARATPVWFVNGSSPSAPSLTASRLKPAEAPPRGPPAPASPLAAEWPYSPRPAENRNASGADSDRVTMWSTPPIPFEP